jgi:hypothetical protein
MQSERSSLLQPASLPCSEFGRTVLQQDQAVSAVATRYDKLSANYLAFIQLHQSGFGCALMSPHPNGCFVKKKVTAAFLR